MILYARLVILMHTSKIGSLPAVFKSSSSTLLKPHSRNVNLEHLSPDPNDSERFELGTLILTHFLHNMTNGNCLIF